MPLAELVNSLIRQPLASTTTPLAANGVFNSGWITNSVCGRIVGTCFADQAGTLYIEQSNDALNPDTSSSIGIVASTPQGYSIDAVATSYRVRYVNGSTLQTIFRIYTNQRHV